jgi:hypothetical protein
MYIGFDSEKLNMILGIVSKESPLMMMTTSNLRKEQDCSDIL